MSNFLNRNLHFAMIVFMAICMQFLQVRAEYSRVSKSDNVNVNVNDAPEGALALPVDPNSNFNRAWNAFPNIGETVSAISKPVALRQKSPLWASSAMGPRILGSVVGSSTGMTPGLYRVPVQASDDNFLQLFEGPKASGGGVQVGNIYYSTYYYTLWDYYVFVIVESWDMDTGERLESRNASSFTILGTDVALDPASGKIYGCYYNSNGSGYCLAEGDYKNLVSTRVCDLENAWNACAINSQGQLYAIDFEGRLLKVDKSTGNSTLVGTSSVKPYYLGSASFDITDNTLYWTVMQEDGASALYKVSTTNAETTLVKSFAGNQQVCGLIVPPKEAEDNAPAAVSDLSLNFDRDNLSGIVSFIAPDCNYNGTSAHGSLNYTVKANGTIVKTGTTSYGAKTEAEVSLYEAGGYKFEVYVSNTAGDGAKSYSKRYIGADTPTAPKVSISYDGANFTINWDAVTTSVNGGYIDPSAIMYKVVRYPDNVVVASSTDKTSFIDNVARPESLVAYKYGVYASYKDKMSVEGMSNEITIGVVIPPYSQEFNTQADFDLFTTFDGNGDGETWYWWKSRKRAHVLYNKKLGIDDWLFTPAVKLEGGKAYPLSFVTYTSGDYTEKFEVKIGKAPNVDSMTATLVPMTEVNEETAHPYSCYIEPTEDGVYYLGFHCNSVPNTDYLDIDDILIGEGIQLHAPESVSELSVVADEGGDKITAISGTTPTRDYSGDALTTLQAVEIYRNDQLVKTIRFPEAGDKFTWADTPEKAGYYTYTVYAVNQYGRGKPLSVKVFVGTNVTEAPKKVAASETGDTGKVTVKWNAPELDKDGNPARLKYVTYSIYDGENKIAESVSGNSYVYDVNIDGGQKFVRMSVVADCESGASPKAQTEQLPVGGAYSAPFKESFAEGKANTIYAVETSNSLDPTYWEICKDESVPNLVSQDGDNGYLVYKCEYSSYLSTFATGKINLSGLANPALTFYSNPLTNGSLNTNTIDVYVSTGNGWAKIRENVMSELLNDGWNKITISLGAYKDKTVRLLFAGTNKFNIYTVIDNIEVCEIPRYNLTAYNIDAPLSVKPNEPFSITATVQNNGASSSGIFTINLNRNNEKVASQTISAVAAGANVKAKFNQSLDILSAENYDYSFDIDYADDAVSLDNVSPIASVNVALPVWPIVKNLSATNDGSKVSLRWDAPDLNYDDPKEETDDFESYTSWATSNVGDWTFVDRDGGTIGALQNITLPGITGKQSFWVMDATLPTLNDSFEAFSGKKYLANMYVSGKQSDDWAISPRLSGASQTISMMVRSYHEDFLESFQILYSVSDTNPDSFTMLSSFTNVPSEWTEYTAQLPEGARYFAIRCVSNDRFMFFIDNVRFIKAHPCEGLMLEGYNVYHNRSLIENTRNLNLDHVGVAGDNHYMVTALYNKGESRPSEKVALTLSGVSDINSDKIAIETDGNAIVIKGAKGYASQIATLGGVIIWNANTIRTDENRVEVPCPGIYIIKVGSHSCKMVVK